MPTISATRAPCSISSRSLIETPLIDSPPFESSIVRGIAFRQRAVHVARRRRSRTPRRGRPPARTTARPCSARKNASSSGSAARWMLREPKPSRAFTSTGIARVLRDVLGRPAARRRDPVRDEEVVRLELVRHARGGVGVGEEDERRREPLALAREHREVEIVERHDEADVVLLAERGERRDVARGPRSAGR